MGSLIKLAYMSGVMCLFCLAACGNETITRVEQGSIGVTFVASNSKLGDCTSDDVGRLAFVADSGKAFFCDGESWHSLDGYNGNDGSDGVDGADGEDGIDGIDGEPGSLCSVNLDGFVYTIVCGKDTAVVDLVRDTPSSCRLLTDENRYTLVCGSDSMVVSRGIEGDPGVDCSVEKDDHGVVTRTCGTSTEKFYSGVCGDTPYDPKGDLYCKGVTLYPKNSVFTSCGEGGFTYYGYYCQGNLIRGAYVDGNGEVYKTVVIDTLEWMSENLHYADARQLCGEGWRLPSSNEFMDLYNRAVNAVHAYRVAQRPQIYPVFPGELVNRFGTMGLGAVDAWDGYQTLDLLGFSAAPDSNGESFILMTSDAVCEMSPWSGMVNCRFGSGSGGQVRCIRRREP